MRRLSSSGEAAISAHFHPTITLHSFKPLITITATHCRRRRKPATAALKLPPPALQFTEKPPRLRRSAAALLGAKQGLKPGTLGAVEGLIMAVSEESERRELGPADIVRSIKHGGGGGRFRKSVAVHARRKLQGFRGFGPGGDDGAGAGAGLPGLLLPFEWD